MRGERAHSNQLSVARVIAPSVYYVTAIKNCVLRGRKWSRGVGAGGEGGARRGGPACAAPAHQSRAARHRARTPRLRARRDE